MQKRKREAEEVCQDVMLVAYAHTCLAVFAGRGLAGRGCFLTYTARRW